MVRMLVLFKPVVQFLVIYFVVRGYFVQKLVISYIIYSVIILYDQSIVKLILFKCLWLRKIVICISNILEKKKSLFTVKETPNFLKPLLVIFFFNSYTLY